MFTSLLWQLHAVRVFTRLRILYSCHVRTHNECLLAFNILWTAFGWFLCPLILFPFGVEEQLICFPSLWEHDRCNITEVKWETATTAAGKREDPYYVGYSFVLAGQLCVHSNVCVEDTLSAVRFVHWLWYSSSTQFVILWLTKHRKCSSSFQASILQNH